MVPTRLSQWSLIAGLLLLSGKSANAQLKTNLEQKTLEAFEEYTIKFEKNIGDMVSGEKPFLWINDQDPAFRVRALRGEIFIFKGDKNVKIPKGIIHVWGVSAYMPGVKAEDAVKLLLDYDRHRNVYPSVIDSRVLERNDDSIRGYLRFKYKKAITVVLNTEHSAKLTRLSGNRYFIRVRSTRIAEVANFGKPDERELPVGRDSGFLWRLNSYWFLDQQQDGIFIECQSLTLTRNIPFGLSWIIRPFIDGIPRDSLKEVVEGTRIALQK